MYDNKLVLEDQVFEMGMTFPDGATVVTSHGKDGGGLKTGGQEGRLAFVIRAVEEILLHTDDIITVVFHQSDDDADSDAYAVVPVTQENGVPAHIITATGADITYKAGEVIMRGLMPLGLKDWTKISITCDDAAMDSNDLIDVFLEYLAN